MTEVSNQTVSGPHGPVPIRIYTPLQASGEALLWIHGGAFISGDLDVPEADATARNLAEHGITVVSVDYRLAVNGVRFPVPLDDCLAVWHWLQTAEQFHLIEGHWNVGGGSAGGNLAAALTARLRDASEPVPASNVLIYPVMHAVPPTPDTELAEALRSVPEELRFDPEPARELSLNYVGKEHLLEHPWAFPIHASAAGFPPTLVITSERDSLRPSGEQYAAKLAATGTDVALIREPDVFHGHLNEPSSAGAQRTSARIVAWLRNSSLRGETHSESVVSQAAR